MTRRLAGVAAVLIDWGHDVEPDRENTGRNLFDARARGALRRPGESGARSDVG